MEVLSTQNYINYLQRYIIFHSYAYYHLDKTYITDQVYDATAKKLVGLKDEYPDLWKNSEYYKQFGDDYNGATGFTLYDELDERQKKIIRSLVR